METALFGHDSVINESKNAVNKKIETLWKGV
jgi:hypothetical protein